jgi:hypothetical protein
MEASIVISKFLQGTILVTTSVKSFFQHNFNLIWTRIQRGQESLMLECYECPHLTATVLGKDFTVTVGWGQEDAAGMEKEEPRFPTRRAGVGAPKWQGGGPHHAHIRLSFWLHALCGASATREEGIARLCHPATCQAGAGARPSGRLSSTSSRLALPTTGPISPPTHPPTHPTHPSSIATPLTEPVHTPSRSARHPHTWWARIPSGRSLSISSGIQLQDQGLSSEFCGWSLGAKAMLSLQPDLFLAVFDAAFLVPGLGVQV